MNPMPSFLKIGSKPATTLRTGDAYRLEDYKPLLGLWLIDLCLMRRWAERPPTGHLEGTFCDRDFGALTGLTQLNELLCDDIELELDDNGGTSLRVSRDLPDTWQVVQGNE